MATGRSWLLAFLLLIPMGLLRAQEPPVPVQPADQETTEKPEDTDDLTALDIEDLLDVEINLASKAPQNTWDVAAAVSVLSGDDVRRLGALQIAEALRAVAGLNVARKNASRWAISARGFADQYANKLLVMIDGRSVYSPLFAGTYWDVQDVYLPDLERIEVVRGPGATLWGSNAVNGVINIRTLSAAETQGFHAYLRGGTEEQGAAGLRYGFQVDDDFFARVYAKGFNRDSLRLPNGDSAEDEWDKVQAGFRADWDPSEADHVTFSADLLELHAGSLLVSGNPMIPTPVPEIIAQEAYGANFVARWERRISDESNLALQFFWDFTKRDIEVLRERRHTFDLDFQHRFAPLEGHSLIWGLGYRISADSTQGDGFNAGLDPSSRTIHLLSAFVQDDVELVEDELFLTLGSKFEYNTYSGIEVQPSVRLRWFPDDTQMLWAAVSRAVRTPSRADTDISAITSIIPDPMGGPTTYVFFEGDRAFDPEELLAFELGYRIRPASNLRFDLALFLNEYDNLRTAEPQAPVLQPAPIPHVILPMRFSNQAEATTYGLEVTAEWQVTDAWRLAGYYSFIQIDGDADGSIDPSALSFTDRTPHHTFHVRSYWDVTPELEVNGALYYVGDVSSEDIPSYWRLDAQLTWRPDPNVAVSLAVQNILDDQHPEWGIGFESLPREAERLFWLSVGVTF